MAKFVVLAQLGGQHLSALRHATEKLPKAQRQGLRKELEKALADADKRSAAAGQAADRLYGTLDRIYRTKVIDSPAEGAFQTTLVMLQALDVMWKTWKKRSAKGVK
jgi:uncharacterized membrane protein